MATDGRQLPLRSVIFDILRCYTTPTVRSDLMQPLAFDGTPGSPISWPIE